LVVPILKSYLDEATGVGQATQRQVPQSTLPFGHPGMAEGRVLVFLQWCRGLIFFICRVSIFKPTDWIIHESDMNLILC
jgi:hypothetical protein